MLVGELGAETWTRFDIPGVTQFCFRLPVGMIFGDLMTLYIELNGMLIPIDAWGTSTMPHIYETVDPMTLHVSAHGFPGGYTRKILFGPGVV